MLRVIPRPVGRRARSSGGARAWPQPLVEAAVDRLAPAWVVEREVDRFVRDPHGGVTRNWRRSHPAICSGDQHSAGLASTRARREGRWVSLACWADVRARRRPHRRRRHGSGPVRRRGRSRGRRSKAIGPADWPTGVQIPRRRCLGISLHARCCGARRTPPLWYRNRRACCIGAPSSRPIKLNDCPRASISRSHPAELAETLGHAPLPPRSHDHPWVVR